MPIGYYELSNATLAKIPKSKHKNVCQVRLGDAVFYVKLSSFAPTPYVLANEYICAELARHVRLPIPPHFIARMRTSGEAAFCSLNFNLKGIDLPPIDAAAAVKEEPDVCTGVLIFDIWIGNTDRHGKNVAFQAERPPNRIGIIDHSHVPFFDPDWASFQDGKLGITGERGNRHALLDFLHTDTYFDKWIRRIQTVPDEYISEILTDAEELGIPPVFRRDAYDYFRRRRDGLRDLIGAHKAEFTAIAQWGLLWSV